MFGQYFYGKLGVIRVGTSQLGFTRLFSISEGFYKGMFFQLSYMHMTKSLIFCTPRYDFVDRRVLPARVLFYTKTANIILFKEDQLRRIAVNINSGPTMWEFVGSNDQECKETSSWTVLCSDISGEKFDPDYKWQSQFCDVEGVTSSFRCLGINILNAPYHVDYDITESADLPKAVIKTIRMWENGKAW